MDVGTDIVRPSRPRVRLYLAFALAAIFARIVIGLGIPLFARLASRDERVGEALAGILEHRQLVAEAIEIVPFLLLGAIAASLAIRSPARAVGLFAAGLAGFALVYYAGYMAYEAYLRQRAWTAASLAAGFVPLKCMGVALVAAIVRAFLGRAPRPA